MDDCHLNNITKLEKKNKFAVILNVSFVFQFCSHPLANLARSGYYQNMKG